MTRTLLGIDPALPLCWEDPQTLRLGFDRPVARVRRPSAATQRLLGMLRSGVPTDRVIRATRRAGASAEEREALLAALAPALVELPAAGSPAPPPLLRVHVAGSGMAATALSTAATRAGFILAGDPSAPQADRLLTAELVISTERYLAEPLRLLQWHAEGAAVLVVCFSDLSVRIGPLAPALGDFCAACTEHASACADPVRPILAAQLLGRVPSSETRPVVEFASATAMALVHRWRAGSVAPGVRLPVSRGLVDGPGETIETEQHPDCPCRWTIPGETFTGRASPGQAARGQCQEGQDQASEAIPSMPASARNLDGARRARPAAAEPESRSSSRARVIAT